MDNQVIELPKKHTLKKRLRDRAHDQKSAMILSIASVLMVTVVTNQWLTGQSKSRSINSDRGIASFESTDSKHSIQWEHELALQLSVEKGLSQASLAERPTLRDELVFGVLQGRYGVKLQNGFVESLEYLESQNGDQPLNVQETVSFLNKYKTVWSKSFSDARLKEIQSGSEIYQLIDDKMTLVGVVTVKKDPQGRLMNLEFRTQ